MNSENNVAFEESCKKICGISISGYWRVFNFADADYVGSPSSSIWQMLTTSFHNLTQCLIMVRKKLYIRLASCLNTTYFDMFCDLFKHSKHQLGFEYSPQVWNQTRYISGISALTNCSERYIASYWCILLVYLLYWYMLQPTDYN